MILYHYIYVYVETILIGKVWFVYPHCDSIFLHCSQSWHMEFNFPSTGGSGIGPLLRHGSNGLITQLCTYDPNTHLTAKQALRHPYFKDIRYINLLLLVKYCKCNTTAQNCYCF